MSFILSALSVNPPIAAIGPAQPPSITLVSPPTGDIAGGTPVTLTGSHFTGTTSVTIAGHTVTGITVVSDTQITGTTSAGVFGDVGIAKNVVAINAAGVGTGAGLFTYTAWFQSFQIGGVNPALFADFTTEGTTNHYLFNSTLYASASAWLTAISATFTRANPPAYYTNSSGSLSSAAANVLRFDYDPIALTPKGILIEGAGTNLEVHSQDTSGWATGNGYNITGNSTTAPDGTTTAIKLTENAAVSQAYTTFNAGATTTASVNVVLSGYFKSIGRRYIILENGSDANHWYAAVFDLVSGTVTKQSDHGGSGTIASASIVSAGNGWWRCIVVGSITLNTASFFQVFSSDVASPTLTASGSYTVTGINADAYYMWGAQIENNVSFASSYIATTTGSATRAADNLTATPITAWYNTTNGVFYAAADTFDPNGGLNVAAAVIGSSSTTDGLYVLPNTNATGRMARIVQGGNQTNVLANDPGQTPYTVNVLRKAAFSINASTMIYVADAGTADTLSASGTMPTNDTFYIQDGASVKLGPMNGHMNQIGYWPVTATAAQLQALT